MAALGGLVRLSEHERGYLCDLLEGHRIGLVDSRRAALEETPAGSLLQQDLLAGLEQQLRLVETLQSRLTG